MMPVMDGPATIRGPAQDQPRGADHRRERTLRRQWRQLAASLGVKHFLPKPFTAETLLKALRQALQG